LAVLACLIYQPAVACSTGAALSRGYKPQPRL